jgi:endonuclease G
MYRFLLTLFLFSSFVSANPCPNTQHLAFNIKDDYEQVDQILCKTGYVVGYSNYYKAPLYVAYRLDKDLVAINNGRGGNPFKEDETIPKEFRATLWDFKYSGYDRGHMAPRAALDGSDELRDETFLLSNMTAQAPSLNQRGWADLEEYVRFLAETYQTIYVVTGSIFDGDNKTIGRGVYVPSHLYKVIYIPSLNSMLGFIVENSDFDIQGLKVKQMKINEIENRAGFDFFPSIKNDVEEQMEKVEVDYCNLFGMGNLKAVSCME